MAAGLAGSGVGWCAGALVGLGLPCAAVGALNGAISGWRGVYRWSSPVGWLAFVLDSSWALVTTTAALGVHAVAAAQRSRDNYRPELSARSGRHVYARGYTLRRGFLLTVGNVVSGAGRATPRARRIVDGHEQVHVWQARWLGPLFPLLYGGWLAVGTLAGVVSWIGRRDGSLPRAVEAWAYYRNPFEYYCYANEAAGGNRSEAWRLTLTRGLPLWKR